MHPNTLKRRKRRQKLLALLGGRCAHCGATENLEFDHIDPSSKKYKMTSIWDWNEANVEAEAIKCQLLCKPCHHAKSLANWEYGTEAPHGTLWRYRKYKCLCDKCKEANDNYNTYRRLVYKQTKNQG